MTSQSINMTEALAHIEDRWRFIEEYDLSSETLQELEQMGFIERKENGRVQIRRTSAGNLMLEMIEQDAS